MPYQKIVQQMRASLLSASTGIFLLCDDDELVDRLLLQLQQDCGTRQLYEWNPLLGWVDFSSSQPLGNAGAASLAQGLGNLPPQLDSTLLLIRSACLNIGNDPQVIAQLQLLLDRLSRRHAGESALILVDDSQCLPQTLHCRVQQLTLPLPDRLEIAGLLHQAEHQGLQVDDRLRDTCIASLRGLNRSNITRLLRGITVMQGRLDAAALQQFRQSRQQQLQRSSPLELIELPAGAEALCGLENLRLWLEQRARLFQNIDAAIQHGVPIPRALLIAGMPGCGKSQSACLAARLFRLPLLRLDIRRLDASNLPRIQSILESLSPGILWIDELERLFVEHPQQVPALTELLHWLRSRSGRQFLIATANDLGALPENLLHRDWFDEMFYVALPGSRERRLILESSLRQSGQALQGLDLEELAGLCDEFSSADILAAVKEALTRAFLDQRPLSQQLLSQAIQDTIPQRETHREQFSRCLRICERLKLRPASLRTGPDLSDMYRLVEDPSHLQRLKVARSNDCPQELLDRLAGDPHPQVRRAVLDNPRCPQSLLSERINIPFGDEDYDSLLLAMACCHRHSPVDLAVSLFGHEQFHPDKHALQLIAANTRHIELQRMILEAGTQWPEQLQGRDLYWRDYERLRFLLAGNRHIELEIQQRLALDDNWSVRRRLAQHPVLHHDTLRQLASFKDMLIDNGLSRNPALHTAEGLQLLEELEVHEFIQARQIRCSDGSDQPACTAASECLIRNLQAQDSGEQLLRPREETHLELFSEPYLIVPFSRERRFRCPEAGCDQVFVYSRTLAPPVEFSDAGSRLSYCPHVFRD